MLMMIIKKQSIIMNIKKSNTRLLKLVLKDMGMIPKQNIMKKQGWSIILQLKHIEMLRNC